MDERSGSVGRSNWPVTIGGMVGAGAGMALALLLGPVVGIDGFWPGVIAVAVAVSVGGVLGRLVGRLLFSPSSGGPPEDAKRSF